MTPGLDRAMLRAQEILLSTTGKHVGAQTALATLVGVKPQTVSLWVAQGYVPIVRVTEVEELTGVPRRELADPDLVALLCRVDCEQVDPS